MATEFTRKLTRRDILRGTLAAAALPILAACAQPTAAPAATATKAPAAAATAVPGAAATAAATKAATQAPVAAGAKPFAGQTINATCWSAPFPKLLAEYLPDFEAKTGMKVNYTTPAFAVHNQQVDTELSTKGPAYDVVNNTFIYTSRWIGAGWLEPLDNFLNDPNKTPADFNVKDFMAGAVKPHQDKAGKTYALPWTADAYMAAAGRFDIIEKAGFKELPKTFGAADGSDEMTKMCDAINKKEDAYAWGTENHYGWSFIPYYQGFGAKIFRNPPDDLMPMLDTPEAEAAVGWFANAIKKWSPQGALTYTYDQVTQAGQQGRINYITFNHMFIMPLGDEKASKVAKTVKFSMCPAGPKGAFPGVASHGLAIPVGSKKKDAAWEFIKWAMGKETMLRSLTQGGYGSQTRQSIIESDTFVKANTFNGQNLAKFYVDTINKAAEGYMAYRTIHVYPQVDGQIDKLIQNATSGAMSVKDACKTAQANSIAEMKKAGVNV
ncbi:MAG: ABC transporter substrate-binding protein [Chloroflexota bacterium]